MRFHFRTLTKHSVTVPPFWKDMLLFLRDGMLLGSICELLLLYSNSYDYLVSKSVIKVLERRRMDDFRMAEQLHFETIIKEKSKELEYLQNLKQKREQERAKRE